jgi:hypothetical protein
MKLYSPYMVEVKKKKREVHSYLTDKPSRGVQGRKCAKTCPLPYFVLVFNGRARSQKLNVKQLAFLLALGGRRTKFVQRNAHSFTTRSNLRFCNTLQAMHIMTMCRLRE